MDTREFLGHVAHRLRCDEARAEGLALVVFQALRDRLTEKEASDVASQLPEALRRMWTDNARPTHDVVRLHRDDFIGRVRTHAGLPDGREAERAVRAVFAALQQLLGSASGLEGEAWDVYSQLPKDLKSLWADARMEPAAES